MMETVIAGPLESLMSLEKIRSLIGNSLVDVVFNGFSVSPDEFDASGELEKDARNLFDKHGIPIGNTAKIVSCCPDFNIVDSSRNLYGVQHLDYCGTFKVEGEVNPENNIIIVKHGLRHGRNLYDCCFVLQELYGIDLHNMPPYHFIMVNPDPEEERQLITLTTQEKIGDLTSLDDYFAVQNLRLIKKESERFKCVKE